jgi:hypothetical protein
MGRVVRTHPKAEWTSSELAQGGWLGSKGPASELCPSPKGRKVALLVVDMDPSSARGDERWIGLDRQHGAENTPPPRGNLVTRNT